MITFYLKQNIEFDKLCTSREFCIECSDVIPLLSFRYRMHIMHNKIERGFNLLCHVEADTPWFKIMPCSYQMSHRIHQFLQNVPLMKNPCPFWRHSRGVIPLPGSLISGINMHNRPSLSSSVSVITKNI